MKNSTKNFLLIMLFCVNGLVLSQEKKDDKLSFPIYANYVSEIYNISCKIPSKFTDLKYIELLNLGKDTYKGSIYCPVVQSDDKECILMYQLTPHYGFLTSDIVKGEIGQMLNLNCCNNSITDTINIEYYATIVSGRYVKNTFNADSIIFMDIPLQSAYEKKYIYCTSMLIVKKTNATMILKWFFTEAGRKNKDKYINRLSKNIWYKDGGWKYDNEKSVKSLIEYLNFLKQNKKP